MSSELKLRIVILARGRVPPLYFVSEKLFEVNSNNPQSGVAVVVGVFVSVKVGVKDAVELGVNVLVLVYVLVSVNVLDCVKVFEGVGDPMNIGGGRL